MEINETVFLADNFSLHNVREFIIYRKITQSYPVRIQNNKRQHRIMKDKFRPVAIKFEAAGALYRYGNRALSHPIMVGDKEVAYNRAIRPKVIPSSLENYP